MKTIAAVIVVLGGLAYGAMNFHFILLDDSLKVLKKSDLNLEYTFVDARGTGKAKLLLNPVLLKAGIKESLREAGK